MPSDRVRVESGSDRQNYDPIRSVQNPIGFGSDPDQIRIKFDMIRSDRIRIEFFLKNSDRIGFDLNPIRSDPCGTLDINDIYKYS